MEFQIIHNFQDFCRELRKAGFSMGGDNAEGIFTLCGYFGEEVNWHNGDWETDPWIWRMRGIEECDDLIYGKLFRGKGGWMTKKWYPYFLSVRREGRDFEAFYEDGLAGYLEKQIYSALEEHKRLSLHELKSFLGITKENSSKFETALTKLQMKLFITICGEKYKLSAQGLPYGWPVTVFTLSDSYLEPELFETSLRIGRAEAEEAITEQIYRLNPAAQKKDIHKFI